MVTKMTSKSNAASAPPVALITGASSGIGEALAHCFAAGGHDVLLVARSADKLKSLAQLLAIRHGVKADVAMADLTKPGAVGNLAAVLKRKKVAINVLVNCAGVLAQGAFTSMENATHQQMIDLNISALTAMLATFVPHMTATAQAQGRHGRILNVASIAAFQPIPMLATYAATKAFVLSLSESLSEELKHSGVTVTALCPGITATPMLSMAADANGNLSKLPGFLVAPVKEVAAVGYAATLRGDAICVPGVVNQLSMISSRATPKWMVRKIGGIFGRNVA